MPKTPTSAVLTKLSVANGIAVLTLNDAPSRNSMSIFLGMAALVAMVFTKSDCFGFTAFMTASANSGPMRKIER